MIAHTVGATRPSGGVWHLMAFDGGTYCGKTGDRLTNFRERGSRGPTCRECLAAERAENA